MQRQWQYQTFLRYAEQTLKLKMAAVMRQSTMDPSLTPSTSSAAAEHSAGKKLMAAIKAEMALFSSSITRGKCLQTVYSWLLTIPPNSVEAERHSPQLVFSAHN